MRSCYKCEQRTIGCHDTCEKYLTEKAKHTEAVRKAANDNAFHEIKVKPKTWHRYGGNYVDML